MGNNGSEERVKKCPFLKEWCSKDVMEACALNTEMRKNVNGSQQKFGMCAFTALVLMISEINAKMPQQTTQLPKILRL